MDRTTSAGYRLPLANRPISAYHERCIPQDIGVGVQTSAPRQNYSDKDYEKCDAVTQDTIWKQTVAKEQRGLKQWNENWDFLTEYDAKGNKKEPKVLPEETSRFSGTDNVPNTNSGNYGNRVSTELGRKMASLEFQFYAQQRKKKLGDDFICY